MDVRSQFAGRYKKDLSIDNLRAKIARRHSVTQKENRHKEFRKSRGLALADANVVAMKEQDLTTVEEVNESYTAKVPINKLVAPGKVKDEMSAARRAMLQRFKEEKAQRKLKEQREKAGKAIFRCGLYKPENPFILPDQHAVKVKQKEKPAPPAVTRVTRSAAKAEAQTTQLKPSQMPLSHRGVPKGRSQPSVLKKNERENKVAAVPTKTTKGTTAAISSLPTLAKGQVKVTAVPKSQKVVSKKTETKVAVMKSEPIVNDAANTDSLAPETAVKEATECATAPETVSPVPHERKPSFAPENFEFRPLEGLSTYTFHPMTPNRANAFLTPSFTWSPVSKSAFVFSREHETEIKHVSPPAFTLKTPVAEQEMETHVSPCTEECAGAALPVTAATPPQEVTLPQVQQEMDAHVEAKEGTAVVPGDSDTPPCDEMVHSPVKQEMGADAIPVDQECTDDAEAAPRGAFTSPGAVTRSPVKQEVDMCGSPESAECTEAATQNPPCDDIHPPAELKTEDQGDAAALPVAMATAPCNQASSPPLSMQPEATQHDVPYFRGLLKAEIQKLSLMCSEWEKTIDMDIPEDAKDLVRTTVGQTRLLMTERFKQFEGLVDNCEFKLGEKETTCTDLDGFWDMIYLQIEDVGKKFVNLEKLEGNSWQQTTVQAKKVVRKKALPGAVKKSQGDDAQAAARRRLAAIKAALRNKVKSDDAVAEAAVPEQPVLANPVVFDAGFFRIESPAKLPGSLRTRNSSQSSCTPKSTKKVLKNFDNSITCREGETAEPVQIPQSPSHSPVRKSLFSTKAERVNHLDSSPKHTESEMNPNPEHTEPEPNPEQKEPEMVMQVVDLSAYLIPNVRLSEGVTESPGCAEYFNLGTGDCAQEDAFMFEGASVVDEVFMEKPEKIHESKSPPPRVGMPEILPEEGVKTVDNPLDFLGAPAMVNLTPLKSNYVTTASDLMVFSPMEK